MIDFFDVCVDEVESPVIFDIEKRIDENIYTCFVLLHVILCSLTSLYTSYVMT